MGEGHCLDQSDQGYDTILTTGLTFDECRDSCASMSSSTLLRGFAFSDNGSYCACYFDDGTDATGGTFSDLSKTGTGRISHSDHENDGSNVAYCYELIFGDCGASDGTNTHCIPKGDDIPVPIWSEGDPAEGWGETLVGNGPCMDASYYHYDSYFFDGLNSRTQCLSMCVNGMGSNMLRGYIWYFTIGRCICMVDDPLTTVVGTHSGNSTGGTATGPIYASLGGSGTSVCYSAVETAAPTATPTTPTVAGPTPEPSATPTIIPTRSPTSPVSFEVTNYPTTSPTESPTVELQADIPNYNCTYPFYGATCNETATACSDGTCVPP